MSRWQQLEKAVKDFLDVKGIKYIRVDSYRCFHCGQVQNAQAAGMPDFLCLYPLVAIECKTGTGRLSGGQKETLSLLERSGVDVIVLHDTIDELIEYFEGKEQ